MPNDQGMTVNINRVCMTVAVIDFSSETQSTYSKPLRTSLTAPILKFAPLFCMKISIM